MTTSTKSEIDRNLRSLFLSSKLKTKNMKADTSAKPQSYFDPLIFLRSQDPFHFTSMDTPMTTEPIEKDDDSNSKSPELEPGKSLNKAVVPPSVEELMTVGKKKQTTPNSQKAAKTLTSFRKRTTSSASSRSDFESLGETYSNLHGTRTRKSVSEICSSVFTEAGADVFLVKKLVPKQRRARTPKDDTLTEAIATTFLSNPKLYKIDGETQPPLQKIPRSQTLLELRHACRSAMHGADYAVKADAFTRATMEREMQAKIVSFLRQQMSQIQQQFGDALLNLAKVDIAVEEYGKSLEAHSKPRRRRSRKTRKTRPRGSKRKSDQVKIVDLKKKKS